MDDSLSVHLLDGVKHLVHEEPSGIFSHSAQVLTEIEKESTLNILHNDVDKVVNDAAGALDDLALVSIFVQFDDALMVKALQNLYFVLYADN